MTRRQSALTRLNRRQIVLSIAIPVLAAILFSALRVPHSRREWREDWRERLEALADDRELALERALGEVVADAETAAAYPTGVYLIDGPDGTALPFPPEQGAVAHLSAILDRTEQEHRYLGFWLIGADARVLATSAPELEIDRGSVVSALKALRGAEAWVQSHDDQTAVLAASVPVFGRSGRPAGVLLVEAPADRVLYEPLRIAALPETSLSAQIAARGPDGEIIFLSPPHPDQPAADGLQQVDMDAPLLAQALSGYEGFVDGVDYRAIPVLAVTRNIEPTGWALVVKVDRADAMRSLVQGLLVEGLAVGLTLVLVIVLTWALSARERARLRRVGEQTRRALTESEEALRTIFDSTYDAIMLHDAEGGIAEVNATFERMYGVGRDQARGLSVADISAHGAPLDRLPEIWARTMAGEQQFFAWRARRVDDDSEFDVEVFLRRVRMRGHDVVLANVRDVSERKRAERAQRESAERFRDLANNISQLAWMADASGNVFWYNQRWFDFTGTTLEQMQRGGWSSVHHPEHIERVDAKIARAFDAGEVWEDTFPLRAADGSYRWFLSRAVPIRDEAGAVVRWFGTNTDITEQLEQERELERRVAERTAALETARERLVSLNRRVIEIQEQERKAVADELHDEAGQSLTALLLSLAMLERSLPGDDQRVDQVRELKTMIDQVMRDFHALAVKLRPISLDRLGVEAALRQLVQTLTGDGLTVEFAASGLSGRRLGNEVETTVYRVVQEALENVRRHARASRAEVVVSRSDETLVAIVEDDGIGFDPETIEPDDRLGLAEMRERAELLSGRLDVDSAPGEGTVVRLEIPLGARPHPEAQSGARAH